MIWLWVTIPPGFANADADIIKANINYSLSLDPVLIAATGNLWQKVSVNCYNWTIYATGTAFTATFIPIR